MLKKISPYIVPIIALSLILSLGFIVVQKTRYKASITYLNPTKPLPSVNIVSAIHYPKIMQIKEEQGTYLINIFASWCASCIEEHQALLALKEMGVTIYGIALQDSKVNVMNMIKHKGNPFKDIGLDLDGKVAAEFRVRGIPLTLIVKNGNIDTQILGKLNNKIIKEVIGPKLLE